MSTANSPSGFDDSFPENDLVLTEDLRKELAEPVGEIVAASSLRQLLKGSPKVVCVGDVVTVTLLELGMEPDVAVFDYKTQRFVEANTREHISKMGGTLVQVDNPPGRITKALWHAVRDAVRGSDRVKIEVTGEEDLASLVAIAYAPERAHVIYGLPQRGLTVVRVDDSTRATVTAAISRMKR
ncbi:MAG: GTP-dependent dephospho-CoA kinase family protein [Thermoplasmata archaeon]|nr:GTP-dependent dephospho-CoA kinase family protein [Thermoplasmata archaeon]